MLYSVDFDKFYTALLTFMGEIECSEKVACQVTGLNRSVFYRLREHKGISGESLAILCSWADLDVRKFVNEEPGQVGRQKSLFQVQKTLL